MSGNHPAIVSIAIRASAEAVWRALTDPAAIKQYMFGSEVTSDWEVGSTITYAGVYEGKEYEDYGRILELKPGVLMRTTHFSPSSGREDVPENYHTLTWRLEPEGDATRVTLTQDNNATEDAALDAESNWNSVLEGLKTLVEGQQ
jgi:uncharacterized protein YndB with AHSA1/START domain